MWFAAVGSVCTCIFKADMQCTFRAFITVFQQLTKTIYNTTMLSVAATALHKTDNDDSRRVLLTCAPAPYA